MVQELFREAWDKVAARISACIVLLSEYKKTFVAELAVMISQIGVYKLAARLLGTEGFSEYAVARRTLAFIYPVALLGMIVALPRFIARHDDSAEREGSKGYFGAALWCVLITTGLICVVGNLFPAQVSGLFFGKSQFAPLVFPLSVMVAGLTFHTVTYAFF